MELSQAQEDLLSTVYATFQYDSVWPKYRDVERSLKRPIATVVGALSPEMILFTRPVGDDTILWLTPRGIATRPEGEGVLQNLFAVVRWLSDVFVERGSGTKVSNVEIERELGLSNVDARRTCEILWHDLDCQKLVSLVSHNRGGDYELQARAGAMHFPRVRTLKDFYAAVNDVNEAWAAESSGRSRPPARGAGSRRPAHASGVTASGGLIFHRSLEAVSRKHIDARHFAEAVRSGLQEFELRVQKLAGLESMGKDLMATAFNEENPRIAVADVSSKRGRSDQEGFKFMAMGAMTSLRNAYSHGKQRKLREAEALEQLGLVSYLFRRLPRRPRKSQ